MPIRMEMVWRCGFELKNKINMNFEILRHTPLENVNDRLSNSVYVPCMLVPTPYGSSIRTSGFQCGTATYNVPDTLKINEKTWIFEILTHIPLECVLIAWVVAFYVPFSSVYARICSVWLPAYRQVVSNVVQPLICTIEIKINEIDVNFWNTHAHPPWMCPYCVSSSF